jgi:hypothetical protein
LSSSSHFVSFSQAFNNFIGCLLCTRPCLGKDLGEKNICFVVFSCLCPWVNSEFVYITWPQMKAQQILGDGGGGEGD